MLHRALHQGGELGDYAGAESGGVHSAAGVDSGVCTATQGLLTAAQQESAQEFAQGNASGR